MNSFIRKGPVDLSKYLPEYLVKDPVFLAMLKAESQGHELQRADMEKLLEQFFVETATDALEKWETFLGIDVNKNLRNEDRRNRILAKIKGTDTVTINFMTEVINWHIPDKSGTVTDHPETYSADFNIPLVDKVNLLGIAKDVRTYIPAHIGQVYKTHADTNIENHIAMLKSTVKTIDVYPAAVEKIAPESTFYAAMAMTTTERLTLYIGGI